MQNLPNEFRTNAELVISKVKYQGIGSLESIIKSFKYNNNFEFLQETNPYYKIFQDIMSEEIKKTQNNQSDVKSKSRWGNFVSSGDFTQSNLSDEKNVIKMDIETKSKQEDVEFNPFIKSGQSADLNYDLIPNYTQLFQKKQETEKFKTPQDISVGLMADMLKFQSKRKKDLNIQNSQYSPLELRNTPQENIQNTKFPDSFRGKIDLFYKFVEDEREIEKNAKKKNKYTDANLEIFKAKQDRQKRETKDIEINSFAGNIVLAEMGLRADGQALAGSSDERRGLGSNTEDVYSQYRKQRSTQYVNNAEERNHRENIDICHLCLKPGHVSKDCKFGLT